MATIYVLSVYEEYGAQNVRATLDREKLFAMVEDYYSSAGRRAAIRANLEKLLAAYDAGVDGPRGERVGAEFGSDLTEGWGGLQLHVVELE